MPDRVAIKRGADWEAFVSDALSQRLQPGSGNKWYARGDSSGRGLRVSSKSEINLTWAKIRKHLMEAIDMAQGTGDTPLLALDDVDNKEKVVVMRLSDFIRVFEEEITIPVTKSKGLAAREKIDTPILLR